MKSDEVYLHHILDAIEKIESYINTGRNDFLKVSMRHDAVIRQLEIIGEATKQLMKFFRPDPRMMKKRIETLVERGFMRRDEEDQRKLHYCA